MQSETRNFYCCTVLKVFFFIFAVSKTQEIKGDSSLSSK